MTATKTRPTASRRTGSPTGPTYPSPASAPLASIWEDLEAGEMPIPLRELSSQSFVPRKNGKRPHPSRWYRWAATGELETIKTPTLCSTRGAVLRMFAKWSAGAPAPQMTTSAVRRQRQQVDHALDHAGIA